SILIEHFAGNFPVWIAPVQIAVLPISDAHTSYAEQVKIALEKEKIRCQLDTRNEKIGYKIREAEMKKIPYILVVGEKEMQTQTVAVRRHGKGDQGAAGLAEFIAQVKQQIEDKILD
ncbi:MAG TPA: His/Gly/Thr/Pro-type tRNA ligase C-terminal domain-containing protein, partial [bacterium]|nr:His/Gly/Thr/Pro-type tRNA ligase C-terminal domain-containing protein [bacterium]